MAAATERFRAAADAALGPPGALLPRVVPATSLSAPWLGHLELCRQLAEHFPAGRGGVRRWLDVALEDDPGTTEALTDDEATALLSALCALGHTYRWDTVPPVQERFTDQSVLLPLGLRRPWAEVAARFDVPRVGSAWTLHLCNWAFRDPSHSGEYSAEELTPERLRVAHQWLTPPADGDLERFSLAFVLMEARAGEAVDAAAAAVSAAEERDPHRLAEHLERLAASMREASREFVVAMREDSVASRRWLELVQPTMAWALSRNGEESLPGPNGLQLPSWQICDTVLGIPRQSGLARQAVTARAGMPLEHRRLLTTADACSTTIRTFVLEAGTAVARKRYEEALDVLRRFRTAHRVRAARYLRAGRAGTSARVSTGLGLEWRPDTEPADPVEAFERLAEERVAEVTGASLETPAGRVDHRRNALGLLSPEEVVRLLSYGRPRRARHDDTVLRTGETNGALWLVVDGLVRVETHPLHGRPVTVDQLGPGELFGEISFLTGLPASAWVRAEGDVELVSWGHEELAAVLAADLDLANRFHRSLAVSLARRLRETTSLLTDAEAGRVQTLTPRKSLPLSSRLAGRHETAPT